MSDVQSVYWQELDVWLFNGRQWSFMCGEVDVGSCVGRVMWKWTLEIFCATSRQIATTHRVESCYKHVGYMFSRFLRLG
jgi:hypothetical protein